jgi:hypothetical protein
VRFLPTAAQRLVELYKSGEAQFAKAHNGADTFLAHQELIDGLILYAAVRAASRMVRGGMRRSQTIPNQERARRI